MTEKQKMNNYTTDKVSYEDVMNMFEKKDTEKKFTLKTGYGLYERYGIDREGMRRHIHKSKKG